MRRRRGKAIAISSTSRLDALMSVRYGNPQLHIGVRGAGQRWNRKALFEAVQTSPCPSRRGAFEMDKFRQAQIIVAAVLIWSVALLCGLVLVRCAA